MRQMLSHLSSERACVSPKSLEGSLHEERQEVNRGTEDVQLLAFGKEVATALLRRRIRGLPRDQPLLGIGCSEIMA